MPERTGVAYLRRDYAKSLSARACAASTDQARVRPRPVEVAGEGYVSFVPTGRDSFLVLVVDAVGSRAFNGCDGEGCERALRDMASTDRTAVAPSGPTGGRHAER